MEAFSEGADETAALEILGDRTRPGACYTSVAQKTMTHLARFITGPATSDARTRMRISTGRALCKHCEKKAMSSASALSEC
eukprot:5220340-Pyramimonas_sp.AAC.1